MVLTKPQIVTRDKWGALPPELTNPNYYHYTENLKEIYHRLTYHHSAGVFTAQEQQDGKGVFVPECSNIDEELRNIQKDHINRGYGDIAYHYIVAGYRIFQGRSIDYRGCHVAGGNTGNLGICVLGNYEFQVPTQYVINNLIDLTIWWATYFRIHIGNIQPHSFYNATACPGKNLTQVIPYIKEKVKWVFSQNESLDLIK